VLTARADLGSRSRSSSYARPPSLWAGRWRRRSQEEEIYKYEAPWPVYSMNWSVRPDKGFRLALGAPLLRRIVALDDERGELTCRSTFDHPYPTTRIMWMPDSKGSAGSADLLATSGDYLRSTRTYSAPPAIDTTCTIWGLETGQVVGRVVSGHVKTQLIAHDKEVYDIAFSRQGGGRDMFASVGADGSVRMFDLRHLEHSTIIYEDPGHSPLLRLAWNRQDPNYLATFAMDASEVIVLDTRVPCTPWRASPTTEPALTGWPGATLRLSHLHCGGRLPGADLGPAANAAGRGGPGSWPTPRPGRDQPDPVEQRPQRLDLASATATAWRSCGSELLLLTLLLRPLHSICRV
uniref:WD_REPEATS_REGION domain-containing protein n=1 Tax=Macrostomum lignano TaxID=282301 RepID=A0A1I8FAI2_9PLAT